MFDKSFEEEKGMLEKDIEIDEESNSSIINENDLKEEINYNDFIIEEDDSVSEEDNTYNIADDGFHVDEDGNLNYNEKPNLNSMRIDYKYGDNPTYTINGMKYSFKNENHYSNDVDFNLMEHCYERASKNMKINNPEKEISINDYKKGMLKAMGSREYTESYLANTGFSPFDKYFYVGLKDKFFIGTDSDLNKSKKEREEIAKEVKKNTRNDNLLFDEEATSQKGYYSRILHDERNFTSLKDAIASFRLMESYTFNRFVGAGDARFANKSLLNKTDYNCKIVSFDIEKANRYQFCITNDEIITRYFDTLTNEERNRLYDTARTNIALAYEENSFSIKGQLSTDRVDLLCDAVNLLQEVNKYNQKRNFFFKYFSPSYYKERALINDLKNGLMTLGFDANTVEGIKNNDIDAMSVFGKEITQRHSEYVKEHGDVSEKDALTKIEDNEKAKEEKLEKEEIINNQMDKEDVSKENIEVDLKENNEKEEINIDNNQVIEHINEKLP